MITLRGRRGGPEPRISRRDGFAHLSDDDVYLDSACQTPRTRPALDALAHYSADYAACGGRVQYAWGRRVDEEVAQVRREVLSALRLPARRYSCAFTLNTTYGLNLLLQQLAPGRWRSVVTTPTEHNAVFVATMTAARRLHVPRVVAERAADGGVDTEGIDLDGAVVVVSAMDNVTGRFTTGLADLVDDVHRRGGVVIVDAAQAAPHALTRLRGMEADALCFSGHKLYGPSLGVVAAANELLAGLEPWFVGGGQVAEVSVDGFTLLSELHTRLEPGLQAWGEIIAFGAALRWFQGHLSAIEADEARLAERLFEGLAGLPRLRVLNDEPSPVVSAYPERVDAHRLAVFLSRAGVMVRSGHFCAHHWLHDRLGVGPLVRFSIGAHTTDADVDRALEVVSRLVRSL